MLLQAREAVLFRLSCCEPHGLCFSLNETSCLDSGATPSMAALVTDSVQLALTHCVAGWLSACLFFVCVIIVCACIIRARELLYLYGASI